VSSVLDYFIGHADGLAGRPVHPDFLDSRDYLDGWDDGQAVAREIRHREHQRRMKSPAT
jgi:hypothetical protein